MTKQKQLPEFFINAFYESKFRDNLFIIKASGAVIEDDKARSNLMANIRELKLRGIKVILIYGGGLAIDAALKTRGIEVKKSNGRRLTDAATIQVIREVIGGDLSLRVMEAMHSNDLRGLSFNAIPADWMKIAMRPKQPVDFGFVGDIHDVYTRPVQRLLKTADFIACPCLALAESGELCNINADTIATALAMALKADKLIFLSNVDGVKIDGETAMMITSDEIPALIEKGIVTDGMRVKMENCVDALDAGVKRIHLINGLRENALHCEIFESVGPGTMLLHADERESYMNEVNVQKAIEGK